jgi:hypothetical protein
MDYSRSALEDSDGSAARRQRPTLDPLRSTRAHRPAAPLDGRQRDHVTDSCTPLVVNVPGYHCRPVGCRFGAVLGYFTRMRTGMLGTEQVPLAHKQYPADHGATDQLSLQERFVAGSGGALHLVHPRSNWRGRRRSAFLRRRMTPLSPDSALSEAEQECIKKLALAELPHACDLFNTEEFVKWVLALQEDMRLVQGVPVDESLL